MPENQPLCGLFPRRRPRNSRKTVQRSYFPGIQPVLPCVFPRKRRCAPMEGARLWTIVGSKPCTGTKPMDLESLGFQGLRLCSLRIMIVPGKETAAAFPFPAAAARGPEISQQKGRGRCRVCPKCSRRSMTTWFPASAGRAIPPPCGRSARPWACAPPPRCIST